jgi:hypothetical protein
MSIPPAAEVVGSPAPAGSIAPWQVGQLDPPPEFSWRQSAELIGPGVLIAGSAIGAGEWLFGPAVMAQYGGTFLWLATCSIICQVVYNLEVMRYALYCGEPIFIGFFRTRPGPRFWLVLGRRSRSSAPSWEMSRSGSRRFIRCTSTARSCRVSYSQICSCNWD